MPSGRTHFMTGVLATGAALYEMNGPLAYSIVGGLAALGPDIDMRTSTLGRLLPFHLIFKHRGFTHSYLAVLLLGIGLAYWVTNVWILLSVLIGYVSHIWLDYLIGTRGVQLWWPKKGYRYLSRIWKGGKRR